MKRDVQKLLIVDDHPIFRAGLKQTLEGIPWIEVVAEAATGDEAISQIRRFAPDMVTLDIAIPGMDGLKVLELTREETPIPSVIIVTSYDDRAYLSRAFELGARGYVIKDCAVTDLITSIEEVAKGGIFISPSLGNNKPILPNINDPDGHWLDLLTATEKKVLLHVAAFQTSKEIARALGMSPRTVQNHRAHICTKLELRGAHQLMEFAVEHCQQLQDS
ncbi:MAG: response regulator transcription factor [Halioglobus sp.]